MSSEDAVASNILFACGIIAIFLGLMIGDSELGCCGFIILFAGFVIGGPYEGDDVAAVPPSNSALRLTNFSCRTCGTNFRDEYKNIGYTSNRPPITGPRHLWENHPEVWESYCEECRKICLVCDEKKPEVNRATHSDLSNFARLDYNGLEKNLTDDLEWKFSYRFPRIHEKNSDRAQFFLDRNFTSLPKQGYAESVCDECSTECRICGESGKEGVVQFPSTRFLYSAYALEMSERMKFHFKGEIGLTNKIVLSDPEVCPDCIENPNSNPEAKKVGEWFCSYCEEPFENLKEYPSEWDECPKCLKNEKTWLMRVKRSLFRKEQRQWDEKRISDSEKEGSWVKSDPQFGKSIMCEMCMENDDHEKIERLMEELGDYNEDVSHVDFYRVVFPKPGVSILCEECATEGGLLVESGSVEDVEARSRHIPERVKNEVWRRDMGKCAYCGSNENLEYDHIIPHSRGGANTTRNLQLLCDNCNRSKSDNIG